MARKTENLKVIIAGSRNFLNKRTVFNRAGWWYGALVSVPEITVFSGTADGADKLGEEWAAFMNFRVKLFPADWNTHGKQAGILRNVEMASEADVLLAFWDGKSPGTKHMITEALRKGLEVHVWQERGE